MITLEGVIIEKETDIQHKVSIQAESITDLLEELEIELAGKLHTFLHIIPGDK